MQSNATLFLLFLNFLIVAVAFKRETSIDYCIKQLDSSIDSNDIENVYVWYYRTILRLSQDSQCLDVDIEDNISAFRHNYIRRIEKKFDKFPNKTDRDKLYKAQIHWLKTLTQQEKLPSKLDNIILKLKDNSINGKFNVFLDNFIDSLNTIVRGDESETEENTKQPSKFSIDKICKSKRLKFLASIDKVFIN